MTTFLLTIGVIMLALGLVSYVSSKRADHRSEESSALSLLPGDIKYGESERQIRLLLSHHDVNSH